MGETNNLNQINEIISSIDLLSSSVESIMSDFGDINYDKSLDIKVLMNSVIDNVAKMQFANDSDKQVVRDALVTKLKPSVERLKQFYVNRKNYLSAEYDVLTMTNGLQQTVSYAEQSVPEQQGESQSQSQTEERGKVRTLVNPATQPSSHPIAA
jgi:ElaB/YqjD/DUF883 family membrane-anchored ribosome-binding protein